MGSFRANPTSLSLGQPWHGANVSTYIVGGFDQMAYGARQNGVDVAQESHAGRRKLTLDEEPVERSHSMTIFRGRPCFANAIQRSPSFGLLNATLQYSYPLSLAEYCAPDNVFSSRDRKKFRYSNFLPPRVQQVVAREASLAGSSNDPVLCMSS